MRNTTVAIGLGANLDNPLEQLRQALQKLKAVEFLTVKDVSSLYESEAQLPDNADTGWNQKFLNAVVLCSLQPQISAESLLSSLKKIESEMGRQIADKWAPRVMDLDILFWDRGDYSQGDLHIPHHHLAQRPFALLPLLEVWPDVPYERPQWANAWVSEKPFKTQVSQRLVWPRLVGVLNITSDSFSDGGLYLQSESLLAQVDKLISQGADILDIGAESTRPQAASVTEEQEKERLSWALSQIFQYNRDLKVSLDCRRSSVVAAVLEKFNISYLNDVSGFSSPTMKDILRQTGKPAFVMHSLTVPADSQKVLTDSEDPVVYLRRWWRHKKEELVQSGVAAERLIFDPGIGFGTSKRQSLYILNHLYKIAGIAEDIMIGHSRKSYQSEYSDRPASQRDLETALVTQNLNMAYVQYLRVHDVESQKIAIRAKVQK